VQVGFGKSNIDEPVEAITVDISTEGVCLFLESPLIKDAVVYLRWIWPDGEVIEVKGKVKYSKRYRDKAYAGIQFIDPEPQLLHRIRIKNMLADNLRCEKQIQLLGKSVCEECQSYCFCTKPFKKKVEEFEGEEL